MEGLLSMYASDSDEGAASSSTSSEAAEGMYICSGMFTQSIAQLTSRHRPLMRVVGPRANRNFPMSYHSKCPCGPAQPETPPALFFGCCCCG